MSCPVATGGCTVGRPAPCRVPWGRGTSSKSPGHVCENGPAVLISKCPVSGEGDVFGCTCQSEQGDWGWGWGWRGGRTGLRSRAPSSQPPAHSSRLPASPTHLDPAPGGSIRIAGARTVGSGSGSLLIARRLWGTAPRRNSQGSPGPSVARKAPLRGLLSTLSALSTCPPARPGCRPLPHLSAARLALREVEVAQVGILSRLLCIYVGLSVQAPSASHTTCHSVWLPASPEGRHPAVPGTPRTSGPARAHVHLLDARAGGETGQARRAIGGPTSSCLCLLRPPAATPRSSPHSRRAVAAGSGCQAERGPECDALGHPFQASRPETKLPSRAACQLPDSITPFSL